MPARTPSTAGNRFLSPSGLSHPSLLHLPRVPLDTGMCLCLKTPARRQLPPPPRRSWKQACRGAGHLKRRGHDVPGARPLPADRKGGFRLCLRACPGPGVGSQTHSPCVAGGSGASVCRAVTPAPDCVGLAGVGSCLQSHQGAGSWVEELGWLVVSPVFPRSGRGDPGANLGSTSPPSAREGFPGRNQPRGLPAPGSTWEPAGVRQRDSSLGGVRALDTLVPG